MCISVSLSGSVVLGCLFAPKVHIILFQPQKNVASLRVTASRFSATVSASASGPSSSYSKGSSDHSSWSTHPVLCIVKKHWKRQMLAVLVTTVSSNSSECRQQCLYSNGACYRLALTLKYVAFVSQVFTYLAGLQTM